MAVVGFRAKTCSSAGNTPVREGHFAGYFGPYPEEPALWVSRGLSVHGDDNSVKDGTSHMFTEVQSFSQKRSAEREC